MKIVHVSLSDFRGSASRGGHALHLHAQERAIPSRFFSREGFHKETLRLASAEPNAVAALTQKACFGPESVSADCSSFTLGYPSSVYLDPKALGDFDLLHLHDVKDLFSPVLIRHLLALDKPVIWSLPDMWAFTGGCHHALDCRQYKGECKNCPQLCNNPHQLPSLLLQKKRELLASPNLHIVAPTEWLAERARESGVFGPASIQAIAPVIPAGICPMPKAEARAQLGFDPEAFTLLVVCESSGHLERFRHGVETLLANFALFQVFKRLSRKKQLRVIVLGGGPEALKNDYGTIQVGSTGDYPWLSRLLSAADIAVLPDPGENGAGIIMEAAACGTPVVAMRTEGIEQLVRDGETGRLVPLGDSRRMAEEISYLALHREIQAAWQKNCRDLHAETAPEALRQHLALYDELSHAPQGKRLLTPVAPRDELPDLLPVFVETLNSSVSYVVSRARDEVAAARAEDETLKAALTASLRKIALAEQRITAQLPKLGGNSRIESSVVSLGKLRNYLTRILREHETEKALQKSRFEGCIPAPAAPYYDHASREASRMENAAGRLLKWAYEAYLSKRHATEPGTLEQHPPRPMIPEEFPKPRLAPRKLPSIAIVTPSYMQGRYIEETILSVIGQDYPKLRYAVQDAGSTDETLDILKKHSGRITSWVSEPDTGQSRAVACGFEKISGEIMAWLNSDDLLMPGSLQFVAEYFRKHPEVDALYGHRVVINEKSEEIGRWVLPPHDPEVLRSIDYVPQETLFWRESLWKRVGGISTHFRFALDWDLLLRFQTAGARIVRVPYFLGCFRVHTLQKTSAQMETIGAEEVNGLRLRTPGALTDATDIAQLSQRVMRQSALYAWLLRRGIRL
ncbi:MAG: glycosyltransferase [Chthoniobacteraceae bacterium]